MFTSSFFPKKRIAAADLETEALCAQKHMSDVQEMIIPGNIVKENNPRPLAAAFMIRKDANME